MQARLATEGPLPAEEAAEFAAEVADALAALHARGLVQGRLGLGTIVRDEGGPLRLEDCATAARDMRAASAASAAHRMRPAVGATVDRPSGCRGGFFRGVGR